MKRNIYLDYLRGFSAIAVMLYHYTTRYEQLFGHSEEYPLYFQYGSYGVLVFFLLSGYLTFCKLETFKPISFLKKRFVRLYPAYWIALIITACLTLFFLPELSVSLTDFLLNFTMIQIYLGAKNVDGAYWTLSCELAFYLFIAFVCFIKVDGRKAALSWLAIQLIIILLPKSGIMTIVNKVNDLLYFHCFMAGGLVSLLEKELFDDISSYKSCWKKILYYIFLIGGCLFFVSQQFISHEKTSGYFMGIVVILLLVSVCLFRHYPSCSIITKLLSPIAWFASISYPFYLIHQNLGYLIIRNLETCGFTSELWLLIPITLVTFLAFIMHKYIEMPFQNNRR